MNLFILDGGKIQREDEEITEEEASKLFSYNSLFNIFRLLPVTSFDKQTIT